ncbi:MAG TPA: hypothetical protein VND65_19655 [Candidatus Binatia bacterium]|nr:hypothetical protein [Candidatus Binatia bacterium]
MTESATIVTQDAAIKQLNDRLAELKTKSEIAVTDQTSFIKAAEVKVELESYVRAVEHHFEPQLAPAEETVAKLKLQMSNLLAPAKQWLKGVIDRRKKWAEEERRRAEAEERRINEERRIAAEKKAAEERKERERQAEEDRKKREKEIAAARRAGELGARESEKLKREAREAEQRERERAAADAILASNPAPVTVQANIPTVAGSVNRRNWKFEVVDASKLPREYMIPDLVGIGEYVRRRQNKDAELFIPGIRVWSE